MGLKKRAKVSAEFSMASLTDIIFLLLIFFMLTSNIAGVPSMDLPESDSKTVAGNSMNIAITKDGAYSFNGNTISSRLIESKLRRTMKEMEIDRKNATLTIAAEKGVPFSKVTALMEIAAKLKMKAIIATQPTKK